MKTILVTGAGGYIGRHVVAKLDTIPNIEVIAADVVASPDAPVNGRAVCCDLFSEGFSPLDAFGEIPDVCLHLAWRNGFNHKDASHMTESLHIFASLTP